jgi:hypothetical protein
MLFFAIARTVFWMVQRIFLSQKFHVRKEYTSHHPNPPLVSSDGATTNNYNKCVCFLSIYFLSIHYY